MKDASSAGFPAALLLLTVGALGPTAGAQTGATVPPDSESHNSQTQGTAAPTPTAKAAAAKATPVPNANCTLIVPKDPLTAAGLSTPYQLVATDPRQGPCNESNAVQSAFVQAAIFDPATGAISIYSPLVMDRGAKPAEAPVVPNLPAGAIVATWFGYNGGDLALQAAYGDDLAHSNCVNGTAGGVFGQFSYCNAPAFFKAANGAIASGKLKVPALGMAKDGRSCPTVRDFFIVDQDQSDNLPTLYLLTPHGRVAQYTKKNQAAHPLAVTLGNPSDNRLTDVFVDGALGCKPWMAPDLTDPGQMVPALALNELQARVAQPTPVALIPGGDPMAQVDGNDNRAKTNLYRLGVNQPAADSYFDIDTARYCRQIVRTAPGRMLANKALLSAFASPDTGAANSLYTFMAQRLVATYQILSCATLINAADPVSVTNNAQGVAVSATIDTAALGKIIQKIAPQRAEDDSADGAQRSM